MMAPAPTITKKVYMAGLLLVAALAVVMPYAANAGGGGGGGGDDSGTTSLGGDTGGAAGDFGFDSGYNGGYGGYGYGGGYDYGNGDGSGSSYGGSSGYGGSYGGGGWSPPPPQCSAYFYCSGNDLYYVNSSCDTSFVQTCAYQCAGGSCIVAPPPQFVPFTATLPNPPRGTGGTFMSTGHLQARPTLVRVGDDAQLYWNLTNVRSCTVTGTNGFSSSGPSSGAAGQNSGTILTRTTFTLHCTALPTGNPPTVTETRIINVAPSFNEN